MCKNKESAVALYNLGLSMGTIAKQMGTHEPKIRDYLLEAGVKIRPTAAKKLSDEQLAEAAQMYRDGATLAELARHYDMSYQALRGRLVRSGVEIRPWKLEDRP